MLIKDKPDSLIEEGLTDPISDKNIRDFIVGWQDGLTKQSLNLSESCQTQILNFVTPWMTFESDLGDAIDNEDWDAADQAVRELDPIVRTIDASFASCDQTDSDSLAVLRPTFLKLFPILDSPQLLLTATVGMLKNDKTALTLDVAKATVA